MALQIPIGEIVNAVSLVILAVLTIRLWRHSQRASLASLQSFTWFFTFLFLLMFILSLPGLVIRDLLLIQILYNIAHTLLFYIVLAFFTRVALLFAFPLNRTLLLGIPLFLFFFGAALFFLMMLHISPVTLFSIPETLFVLYEDSAPPLLQFITGLVGLSVFGSGAAIFFRETKRAAEKIVRKKSLLLALASVSGVVAILFNFVFATHQALALFSLWSSLGVLLTSVLVYMGATLKSPLYKNE